MNNLFLSNGTVSDATLLNEKTTKLLMDCVANAAKAGLLKNTNTSIKPELSSVADSVCLRIINELDTTYQENDSCTVFDNLNTAVAWCMYAGIGASYIWVKDSIKFKNNDLFGLLTSIHGIREMDKYILNLIDIRYSDYQTLCNKIQEYHNYISQELKSLLKVSDISSITDIKFILVETCKILYYFGIIYHQQRASLSVNTTNVEQPALKINKQLITTFLHRASFARSYPSDKTIKEIFSYLNLLSIDKGYVFDHFEYREYYDTDGRRRETQHKETHFYIRKIRPPHVFEVKVKRNYLGFLFGNKEKITYKYPKEYSETAKIKGIVYTKEALNLIPHTTTHLNVPFTPQGLLQLILYVCFLNGFVSSVIFDKSEIEIMHKDEDMTGGYLIDDVNYKKAVSFSRLCPTVIIDDNLATISLCQIYDSKIICRELKVSKDGTKVKPIHMKRFEVAKLYSNTCRILAGRVVSR